MHIIAFSKGEPLGTTNNGSGCVYVCVCAIALCNMQICLTIYCVLVYIVVYFAFHGPT